MTTEEFLSAILNLDRAYRDNELTFSEMKQIVKYLVDNEMPK